MILVVGVNGTGKTTTIGKLAWHLRHTLGQKVVVGAADTFRAAAVEQLERWAERADVELVKGPEGSDPGAVAFDAVARGRERGADVVIVDTAGRLHTQHNLMEELTKVRRVITKQMPDAPHETLMTVDATTGQNGVRQAKLFGEAVGVTGIVLTKLDGTAKGGIALAIASELGIPVKLIGIGEQLEDLRPFDADDFAKALLTRMTALLVAAGALGGSGPERASSRSTSRSHDPAGHALRDEVQLRRPADPRLPRAAVHPHARRRPRPPPGAGRAAAQGLQPEGLRLLPAQRAVDQFARWAENPADQKMKREFYPHVDKSRAFDWATSPTAPATAAGARSTSRSSGSRRTPSRADRAASRLVSCRARTAAASRTTA